MSSIRETAERIAAPTIGKVAPAVYREIVADIEQALRNRDERAAKIADERAAFNRRLAHGSKISDAIDSRVADLKLTRADEAEVIASEIRGGKQSQDYATVRTNAAVAAIRKDD